MIPNDNEFDVFVNEGVLVEVWHGQRISAAQQFGVDWDGPTHSVMHAAVFAAEELPGPFPGSTPWNMRAVAVLETRWCKLLLLFAAVCCACVEGHWRGWW